MEGRERERGREAEDDEECWLVYELKFQQQIAMYTQSLVCAQQRGDFILFFYFRL